MGESGNYSGGNNNSYSGSGGYYNNNNNNNNRSSGYYSNNYGYGNNHVPSSRRPDGSYRNEIRVRPGFVPEAERQSYVPPAARSSITSQGQGDDEDSADRIDSWADEVAPVISDFSEVENEEIKKEKLVEKDQEKPDSENSVVAVPIEPVTREPRKPSQLATAIDTALDSLSLDPASPSGESPSSANRPIGRFAAQIANDEREGRSYRGYGYGCYNRDREGGSNRDRDNNGSYNNYSRDNRDYRDYNRSSYNNWNRNSTETTGSTEVPASTSTAVAAVMTSSPSSEIRLEKEFKSFLEQLTALRREMAVINAKLEYIKYIKGLGREDLSGTERERLGKESGLIARMNAIFEAIDALNNKI